MSFWHSRGYPAPKETILDPIYYPRELLRKPSRQQRRGLRYEVRRSGRSELIRRPGRSVHR